MSPAPDLEISLPARAENVAIVRHVLGGLGDALGIDEGILADVKLAVSEACTNVVVHAYGSDGGGLLDLDVCTRPERLELVVRDHGRGMAPRADSPGLGVGLPLIASLSDTLELGTVANGGTEVRMAFALQARDATRPEPSAASRAHTGAGGPAAPQCPRA
jgi:anti-sigma regulatory factor (Ser/Thr protein kinase)